MAICTCIKLKTVDQRLTVVQQPVLASGDVGTVRAEYALDSFWNGYTPTGTFFTGKHPEDVYEVPLENGACVIPWEVLQEDGILYIGLRGVDGSGLVKTAAPVRYRVELGSKCGTDTAKGPTPDVYQRLLTAAENAESIAQSVRDDADAGKFNGKDGKDGKDGTGSGNSYITETEQCNNIFPEQSYHNLDHSPAVNFGDITDSPVYNLTGYNRGKELYEGRNGVYENGYSSDAVEGTSADYDITGYIPLTQGHTMRISGMRFDGNYGGIAFYSSTTGAKGFVYMSDMLGNGVENDSGAGKYAYGAIIDANGVLHLDIPDVKVHLSTATPEQTGFASYAFDHVRICCSTMDDDAWSKVIITIDENIAQPEITLDPSVKVTLESLPQEIVVGASGGNRILNRAAFTSGVFWDPEGTSMNAYVYDTMKVRIDPGVVMLDGVVKEFKATTRTYNTQDTDRINACVIRLDQNTGEIKMYFRECIEQGDLLISVDDNALLPIRNDQYYDIVICCMRIPAGTTQITSSMVYNMQDEETYCGYVRFNAPASYRKKVLRRQEVEFKTTDGVLDAYFIDLTEKATYVPHVAVGETYIVKFNDVAYECTTWSDGGSGMYIGNGRILGTWARYDSGLPFVICILNDGTDRSLAVYCDTSGYASIEIARMS